MNHMAQPRRKLDSVGNYICGVIVMYRPNESVFKGPEGAVMLRMFLCRVLELQQDGFRVQLGVEDGDEVDDVGITEFAQGFRELFQRRRVGRVDVVA